MNGVKLFPFVFITFLSSCSQNQKSKTGIEKSIDSTLYVADTVTHDTIVKQQRIPDSIELKQLIEIESELAKISDLAAELRHKVYYLELDKMDSLYLLNTQIYDLMKQAWGLNESFYYPFKKVEGLMTKISEDDKVKIYSWTLCAFTRDADFASYTQFFDKNGLLHIQSMESYKHWKYEGKRHVDTLNSWCYAVHTLEVDSQAYYLILSFGQDEEKYETADVYQIKGNRLVRKYGFFPSYYNLNVTVRFNSKPIELKYYPELKVLSHNGYNHVGDGFYKLSGDIVKYKFEGGKFIKLSNDDPIFDYEWNKNTAYDYISRYQDGSAWVKLHGKYGIIDEDRNVLTDYKYDDFEVWANGFIIAKRNEKFGVLNMRGEEIIPCKYQEMKYNGQNQYNGKGRFTVKINDKYGLLDLEGGCVLQAQYDRLRIIHGTDIVQLSKDGQFWFIDLSGKRKYTEKYDRIGYFLNNYQTVYKNNQIGIIDESGNIIVSIQFDEIDILRSAKSMAKVNKDGHWGLLNEHGKEILPCVYDNISIVNKDSRFILLEKDGKKGLLNPFSYSMSECKYDKIYELYLNFTGYQFERKRRPKHYLWKVEMNGKYGLIDSSGIEVTPCEYNNINGFEEGIAVLKKDGLVGYVDSTGHIILEANYENAYDFHNGYGKVLTENGWRTVNRKGEILDD